MVLVIVLMETDPSVTGGLRSQSLLFKGLYRFLCLMI